MPRFLNYKSGHILPRYQSDYFLPTWNFLTGVSNECSQVVPTWRYKAKCLQWLTLHRFSQQLCHIEKNTHKLNFLKLHYTNWLELMIVAVKPYHLTHLAFYLLSTQQSALVYLLIFQVYYYSKSTHRNSKICTILL